MEPKPKAIRDINITAYLFLVYAIWTIYSMVYYFTITYQTIDLKNNPALVASFFLSVFPILLCVSLFFGLRYRNNLLRIVAIIYVIPSMMYSIYIYINMLRLLTFTYNIPNHYWLSTPIIWCFFAWTLYVLFRRDVRVAFEYHKHHAEIAYATANGDD